MFLSEGLKLTPICQGGVNQACRAERFPILTDTVGVKKLIDESALR